MRLALAAILAIEVSARPGAGIAPGQLDYRAIVESYRDGASRSAEQIATAPRFHTGTEAVRVDVFVTDGNTPIAGLRRR
jgi:hypothetical protein